jgi:NAD(P)-dependent dehydrogenase (short-subunit alcohol dehydrogenase family)
MEAHQMNKLNGKVALITGGSTGIGRGTALAFANEGAKVLITGRNEDTLKESAAQHENISYLIADASNPADAVKTIKHVEQTYSALDILVNNAGVALFVPLEQSSLEDFDAQFNTNVRGLYETTRVALPLLEKSKGVILSTASGVAVAPMANAAAYSATKAAVVALTKAWAKELAPKGIRVNAVSPGPIETPIFGKMGFAEEDLAEMAKAIAGQVPLQRFGAPEDIANAFVYLASDDASFVTGAQLIVDGGFTA